MPEMLVLKLQNGKFISFIDSDDYVENDYIEFLYKTLKEDNTKMSICSHSVIYETGKIIEKQTGKREILSKEETLYKILYDDGVDLSAWAKLYDIALFKNIRFPKGRLYEDSATTYLLIDLCDNISVNSISKYNYMIRNNSITNNKFSKKKMDLITSTEEMTTYLTKKYPNLINGCKRRLMYAYLSTLSQLVKDKDKHIEEENFIMNYIKTNKKEVLKDKKIPKRDRFALYSLFGGITSYKIFWNFYCKLTKRK